MKIDIDPAFVQVTIDQGDLPGHFERNQLAPLFRAAADWLEEHAHGDVILHSVALYDLDDGKIEWPSLLLYLSDDSGALAAIVKAERDEAFAKARKAGLI